MQGKSLMVTLVIPLLALPVLAVGDAPPQGVVLAAEEGMIDFLRDASQVTLQNFGFDDQMDANQATLGPCFQIYTILPSVLLADDADQDLSSMAVPTDLWQFIVLDQERPAALLTVDSMDGIWQAVSIGSSGLAVQLSDVLQAWPQTERYNYRLIRVYQATTDLLELTLGKKLQGFVPFTSARISLDLKDHGFDPLERFSGEELLKSLRPTVRSALEQDGL